MALPSTATASLDRFSQQKISATGTVLTMVPSTRCLWRIQCSEPTSWEIFTLWARPGQSAQPESPSSLSSSANCVTHSGDIEAEPPVLGRFIFSAAQVGWKQATKCAHKSQMASTKKGGTE